MAAGLSGHVTYSPESRERASQSREWASPYNDLCPRKVKASEPGLLRLTADFTFIHEQQISNEGSASVVLLTWQQDAIKIVLALVGTHAAGIGNPMDMSVPQACKVPRYDRPRFQILGRTCYNGNELCVADAPNLKAANKESFPFFNQARAFHLKNLKVWRP